MRKPMFKWFYLPTASLIEYRFDNLRTIFSFDYSTDGQSNFMFPLCIERQNFSNVHMNEHTWWQQIESNIHDSLTNYKTHKKGWHQIKLACCKQLVILFLSLSFYFDRILCITNYCTQTHTNKFIKCIIIKINMHIVDGPKSFEFDCASNWNSDCLIL